MIFNNSPISLQQFLAEYWQKKPLLIRQAFPDFKPELDLNDVAGLACEEMAESRLVSGSYPQHDWALRYGPFTEKELSGLPDTNWTLLVQDVEKHYPPLRSLLAEFSFLPSWRIDDLMISVAAPGGSVGPHVDQYDVFLLQASGIRKWQISASYDASLQPDCDLNVLKSFESEQEWILEPGDMLYLPPDVAHHGVAMDECMTWSVGMRAPSSADLFQAFGEWLATHADEGERFRDGQIGSNLLTGEVDLSAVEGFRGLLGQAIHKDSNFQSFLGSFLSSYRLAHEPAAPEQGISVEELEKAISQESLLHHNPWSRLLWLADDDAAVLFAAGDEFTCSKETAQRLCADPVSMTANDANRSEALKLACELVNRGHLYLA